MTRKLDDETSRDVLHLAEVALVEDLGSCDLATAVDVTTLAVVPDNVQATATFVSRKSGVICGIQLCQLIGSPFATPLQFDPLVQDGERVQQGQPIARWMGEARQILMLERTCLNFLCRLSAISTLTRRFVDAVANTRVEILDTRKTTPGWRRIEKYAVACGGGANHRMGLYDAIMIKDNHWAGITEHNSIHDAITTWMERCDRAVPLIVEVDNLQQLAEVLSNKIDVVLLDNMSLDELRNAVKIRDEQSPSVQLEASGGVTLQMVRAIAETGVDRISIGALTHSVTALDLAFDWME